MSREVHVRFCERREVRFLPATHLVALCHSRQEALEVKARLADWLAPRGLFFNEDKTRVVSLDEG
jgi:RNA-directed DNA polymerase